jgi:hypothetical protein
MYILQRDSLLVLPTHAVMRQAHSTTGILQCSMKSPLEAALAVP